jgi:hypothetical protein
VQGYSVLISPLTDLTSTSRAWAWNENTQFAFEHLKYLLTQAPILKLPNPKTPYEVVTDASVDGAGAVLLQEGHPVAYESKKFKPAERNYSTSEQEMLATYFALSKWLCYLEGVKFTLITDHQPNTFLPEMKHILSRRQARWSEFFQRFNFNWEYRPGRNNVADPLSRMPARLACLVIGVRRTNRVETVAMSRQGNPTTSLARKTGKQLAMPISRPLQRTAQLSAFVNPASTALAGDTALERAMHAGYATDPWFRVKQATVKHV